MSPNGYQRWANPSSRPLGWTAFVLFIGMAAAVATSVRTTWWGSILLGVGFASCGYVVWAFSVPVDLVLSGDTLIIRNPYVRPKVVPISSVERIEASQQLILHLVDGSTVRVWAVQAWNLHLMLGRPSYPDRVASELASAMSTSNRLASRTTIVVSHVNARTFGFLVAGVALVSGILRIAYQ